MRRTHLFSSESWIIVIAVILKYAVLKKKSLTLKLITFRLVKCGEEADKNNEFDLSGPPSVANARDSQCVNAEFFSQKSANFSRLFN